MDDTSDLERVKTKAVKMHNLSMSETVAAIHQLSSASKFSYVVTPNIDHVSRLIKQDDSAAIKKAYQNAAISICDSRILEKLLKFKGISVKEVIPGSTLTQHLFDSDIMKGKKIAIIGGEEATLHKVKALYSHHDIEHYNPPMGFIDRSEEVEKVITFCESINAQYYFLAVGSPRQEILALKLQQRLKSGVGLCVGASILLLVGEEKRAPDWIQVLHLEWCFRMLQNPRVLVKRYLGNITSLPKLYKAL